MSTDFREAAYRRPVGDLVSSFIGDATDLISLEFELAKNEASKEVTRLTAGLAMFVVAAILAVTALGALTAAAIVGLDLVMPLWLAALIVGAALLVVTGILALVGRGQVKKASLEAPTNLAERVQKDAEAVQEGADRGFSDGTRETPVDDGGRI